MSCEFGGSISAGDYDRQCDADADCVAVTDGDICLVEGCPCLNAAINGTDAEQFYADRDALSCTRFLSGGESCICLPVEAVCDRGVCEAQRVDDE